MEDSAATSPSSAAETVTTPQAERKHGHLGGFRNTYVRTAGTPALAMIREGLWVGDAHEPWRSRGATYESTLLEQYKIYVEMADRISARRSVANAFFLTLNSAIATVLGVLWQDPPQATRWLLLLPWLALLGQCLAWFWILRSYRQLNTAKYAVIGVMEERLPASPYWAAEWAALGQGHDPARYWPLSHVESWIPLFFAVAYTAGFLAILVTG